MILNHIQVAENTWGISQPAVLATISVDVNSKDGSNAHLT